MSDYEKKLKQQQRFQKRQQESAKRYKAKQVAKAKSSWKYNSVNKKYKPTGEKQLFLDIWNSRKHECCVCGSNINEMSTYCFAHILPKGMYPEYRLTKANIALVCSMKCHNEVDGRSSGNKCILREQIDEWILPTFSSYGQTNTTMKSS